MFRYTKAVCRKIPKSIVSGGLRMQKEKKALDHNLALKQQQSYINALTSLGVKVTVLEADEATPDCVFVEDTAVVVGETVVITNSSMPTRKLEIIPIKEHFAKYEKNKKIIQMESPAQLDGGDVIFTGHEFFVGQSKRTNEYGLETLQKAFPQYPVHGIKVTHTLHLKTIMSVVEEDMLTCGTEPHVSDALEEVLTKATRKYSVLRVPDEAAGNVVLVNGAILCRSQQDYPDSYREFEKLAIKKIDLDGTELEKVDGSFTCCSLLYN
ncbi:N(G),N(G)-dimethylarginine dimethylaminohydrolase 1-like [Hydractinia symbiolongicarpus]|uniref:N(G),N(G)-dimethylarginine dimethylaminohydrolase 1-like n=1 Tax=Hydractinia symbiolongicarpus TaxID=13093 RepID=UPI00254BF695|nr:N(G),N(G)-dimethylarginine dimethylaminohydrolase 1-like [Hydractinia symbiolongicarpus]